MGQQPLPSFIAWPVLNQQQLYSLIKDPYTSRVYQLYQHSLTSSQSYQKLKNTLLWRKQTGHPNIIRILDWYTQDRIETCNGMHYIKIVTQHPQSRLSDLYNIDQNLSLTFLSGMLNGFQHIFKRYNTSFIINAAMVGIFVNQVKVWISDDFSADKPQMPQGLALKYKTQRNHFAIQQILQVVAKHSINQQLHQNIKYQLKLISKPYRFQTVSFAIYKCMDRVLYSQNTSQTSRNIIKQYKPIPPKIKELKPNQESTGRSLKVLSIPNIKFIKQ